MKILHQVLDDPRMVDPMFEDFNHEIEAESPLVAAEIYAAANNGTVLNADPAFLVVRDGKAIAGFHSLD